MLGNNSLRVVLGVGVSAAHRARGPLFGQWIEEIREEDGGHSWLPWDTAWGKSERALVPGKQGLGTWIWPFADFQVDLAKSFPLLGPDPYSLPLFNKYLSSAYCVLDAAGHGSPSPVVSVQVVGRDDAVSALHSGVSSGRRPRGNAEAERGGWEVTFGRDPTVGGGEEPPFLHLLPPHGGLGCSGRERASSGQEAAFLLQPFA